MTPITYLIGDATYPQGDGPKIIAHVCNDVGAWGAGFVLALSKRWGKPEFDYRRWYASRTWNESNFLLGRVQFVSVPDGVIVANMLAQVGIGQCKHRRIRYDYLSECLSRVALACLEFGHSVHMPRIGCGLAGGSWDTVEPIIFEKLCRKDVPVFVYDLPF